MSKICTLNKFEIIKLRYIYFCRYIINLKNKYKIHLLSILIFFSILEIHK
jgi:hypothetical protein